MKRRTLRRSTLSLGAALVGGIPVGHTLAARAAAHQPATSTARATASRTFKGPVEYVNHGPVQVGIVVKNKRITSVLVSNSPQDGRSVVIQTGAIPILRQETLRDQGANVSEVSGATDTSMGYIASLQSAVKKARQARALK